jgi:hypothetical protein
MRAAQESRAARLAGHGKRDAAPVLGCVEVEARPCTAGRTPFYAPAHHFIDMLGLTDATISHRSPLPIRTPLQALPGHEKGDGSYVMSRRPDFIIAGPAYGAPVSQPWFLSDVELGENPEFARNYVLHSAQVPVGDGSARTFDLAYYQRRTGLAQATDAQRR